MRHTKEDSAALQDVLDEQVEWFADMHVGACKRSKMIIVRRTLCRTVSTQAFTREQMAEQVRIALITGNYDRPWLGGVILAMEATA